MNDAGQPLGDLYARAAEQAKALGSFMQHAQPLALVAPDGRTLIENRAMAARYPACHIDGKQARRVIDAAAADAKLDLAPPAGEKHAARARAYHRPDATLFVLGNGKAPAADPEVEQLFERVRLLARLSSTDNLTGTWNRAWFDRMIGAEIERSIADRQPLTLILLDIDHFRELNEQYGHAKGDTVLKEIVPVIQGRIRASDLLFRFGGEEFAVLASTRGHRGARTLAQDLCRAVESHDFTLGESVTVSAGVAEHLVGEAPADWLERLDAALSEAKWQGRNRVAVDARGQSDDWAKEARNGFQRFEWRDAHECGDPGIDAEHRECFTLANALMDQLSSAKADRAEQLAAIDALLEHAASHFEQEESVLKSCSYADLPEHARVHAGLLTRARRVRDDFSRGKAGVAEVVEFVARDIVSRHFFTVDRAFFALFDPALATARTPR